ncbi:twin-arginine translocase TatA/TatE family subunit [Paratractidigestivibacter sp.]|uniref:Sec-independent protein translocase subunit TatA/TatB n=1 Tax=Paratractidigestivibacter sp. TaxID=2847316 RepID=UPI002ABDEC5C|nr:twin-arginine translocase TatA/TatE family subunit [Paratractidigestivibacter sp.]
MFGIGETELVLILLFAFMIFGPDKLPGMGKTLGRALRQFRNAQEGFTQVVQTEIVDPATEAMSDSPKKPNREFDEDADLDGEGAAPVKKAETFAERKRRLEAERKAKEAAEKQVASDEADAPAPEADAPAPEADAPAPEVPADAPTPAPIAEEPKKPSVADLYTMKRPAAPEATTDTQKEA